MFAQIVTISNQALPRSPFAAGDDEPLLSRKTQRNTAAPEYRI
jgi:hypothetical protein